MLNTILRQLNKPTEENFRLLAAIAYDLTSLEFYNYYTQNYYSAAVKQNFFTQYWILRNEVKQLIQSN